MITLGRKGAHEGQAAKDVVDLLLECHDRIRSMTALALRLAAAEDLPDAEISEAADRVRRYFGVALPLHARDEDESVVPRLRGKDPDVDSELDAMSREHGEHGDPLARVVAAADELAREPSRLASVRGELRDAARELERHFDAHLAREERVVFPAIRKYLPAQELAAMAEELRARRTG
jgi:hemerythrin-like domain-containing protein